VTPERVARLTQAQATGRLTMSLVGDDQSVVSENIEVDTNTLLGIVEEVEEVAPVVVEAQKCFAKQRKGGELVDTNVEIPCN
jgi:pilus assembly protein CpaB